MIYIVNVPRLLWPDARNLLTAKEAADAIVGDNVMIVTFPKEDDARAFTQLLRSEHNAMLPVAAAQEA